MRDSNKLKKKRETKENNERQNSKMYAMESFPNLLQGAGGALDEKVCVTALQDFDSAVAAVTAAQKRNSCSRVTPA